MSAPALEFRQVGKKFTRGLSASLVHGTADLIRRATGRPPREKLRNGEFWALRDISFAAGFGECIGIIGPNGAGKSTLLRLVNREHSPDQGRLTVRGRVTSLTRLGSGLQPMLTGRENLYTRCSAMGLSPPVIDSMAGPIIEFAGLEEAIDSPVKHYSDGMYARLEFSLATAVPMDILLVDEVLAVGDMAFQVRALERLDALKRAGTTILLVSHSEMIVRQVADRCLLLQEGHALGFGATDALFWRYYESVGFANRQLKPLGAVPERPARFTAGLSLSGARLAVAGENQIPRQGHSLALDLEYSAGGDPLPSRASLVLEFWNGLGLLMASFDSDRNGGLSLKTATGELRVYLPYLGLSPGLYRVAGGFRCEGQWLGYAPDLLRLTVAEDDTVDYPGLFLLEGKIS